MNKTCIVCGKEFMAHGQWKVCSLNCQAIRLKMLAKAGRPPKPQRAFLTCEVCGNKFTRSWPNQRFCSVRCKVSVQPKPVEPKPKEVKPKPLRLYHTMMAAPDPDPRRREASVAGLCGYYEANTLILMRKTGKTRHEVMNLPCGEADELLRAVERNGAERSGG